MSFERPDFGAAFTVPGAGRVRAGTGRAVATALGAAEASGGATDADGASVGAGTGSGGFAGTASSEGFEAGAALGASFRTGGSAAELERERNQAIPPATIPSITTAPTSPATTAPRNRLGKLSGAVAAPCVLAQPRASVVPPGGSGRGGAGATDGSTGRPRMRQMRSTLPRPPWPS